MTRAHVLTYLLILSNPAQFLETLSHVPGMNASREVTRGWSSDWKCYKQRL